MHIGSLYIHIHNTYIHYIYTYIYMCVYMAGDLQKIAERYVYMYIHTLHTYIVYTITRYIHIYIYIKICICIYGGTRARNNRCVQICLYVEREGELHI